MNTPSISLTLSRATNTMFLLAALMMNTALNAEALGSLTAISKNGSGELGNGTSSALENNANHFSADGRYVTFYSQADNLTDNDTNDPWDVFVYDRQTDTLELVSRASSDENGLGEQGNYWSQNPSISADGRYVAFESGATNLVEVETTPGNVYVYDRDTETTELVSRGIREDIGLPPPGNADGFHPSINADGRYVAFCSSSLHMVDEDISGGDNVQVFVYDRDTDTIELVSRASSDENGLGVQGNYHSKFPSISTDGRYVAFQSSSANLVDNDDGSSSIDIFVYDRDTDTIELVNTTETGEQSSSNATEPILSPDASAVMFVTRSRNFPGIDGSGPVQAYVKQLSSNAAPVANAGNDMILEATGNPNTDVILDGSGSTDEDGDTMTHIWSGDFGEIEGESVTIGLPLGVHSITLTVSDGQLSSSDTVIVTIEDTTPPVLNAPQDILAYAAGALTSVDLGEANATDLFGVTITSDAPEQFGPGETVGTWTASDASGNSATATQMVTVHYEFVGFNGRIENLPVLNIAKAGQVISVRWSVPSSTGGFISDTAIVSSIQFSTESCSEDTVSSNDISDAQSTGKNGLHYDETNQQFIFNWKTSKSMKGTCRMLHLHLNDGTVYRSKFMLR